MQTTYSLKNIEHRLSADFCLTVKQLDLQRETIHVVSGANGAGKSTLLKILAALIQPQYGSLTFCGDTATFSRSNKQQLRRKITMVEQVPFLLSGTVFSNLAFGLKIRRIKRLEQEQRVAAALQQVGLAGFSERRVTGLSGGEVQRVALARALVLNPMVLLLDEPTANIDQASVAEFEQLLQQLAAAGTTVVMSTHDPAQAERLGGKNIYIENGEVGK